MFQSMALWQIASKRREKNVFQSIELKYKILVIELPFFTVGIFLRACISRFWPTLKFTRSPCNQIHIAYD